MRCPFLRHKLLILLNPRHWEEKFPRGFSSKREKGEHLGKGRGPYFILIMGVQMHGMGAPGRPTV